MKFFVSIMSVLFIAQYSYGVCILRNSTPDSSEATILASKGYTITAEKDLSEMAFSSLFDYILNGLNPGEYGTMRIFGSHSIVQLVTNDNGSVSIVATSFAGTEGLPNCPDLKN